MTKNKQIVMGEWRLRWLCPECDWTPAFEPDVCIYCGTLFDDHWKNVPCRRWDNESSYSERYPDSRKLFDIKITHEKISNKNDNTSETNIVCQYCGVPMNSDSEKCKSCGAGKRR